MTASRRQFTFGTLMLALAGPARAATPQPAPPQGEAILRPILTSAITDGLLTVTLSVENLGEGVELVVARGSRPGARVEVSAQVEDEGFPLTQVATPLGRRELMSRRGPVNRWAPIAKGATLPLGTHTFTLPRGLDGAPLTATIRLTTSAGGVSLSELVQCSPAGT